MADSNQETLNADWSVERLQAMSHAELVAEKIGFSSKDIDTYLRRKGYLE